MLSWPFLADSTPRQRSGRCISPRRWRVAPHPWSSSLQTRKRTRSRRKSNSFSPTCGTCQVCSITTLFPRYFPALIFLPLFDGRYHSFRHSPSNRCLKCERQKWSLKNYWPYLIHFRLPESGRRCRGDRIASRTDRRFGAYTSYCQPRGS